MKIDKVIDTKRITKKEAESFIYNYDIKKGVFILVDLENKKISYQEFLKKKEKFKKVKRLF